VENAESIAALAGVGGLFIGPDDLKIRLGMPQSTSIFTTPELRAMIERVVAACAAHGKVVAIPSIRQADAIAARVGCGFVRTPKLSCRKQDRHRRREKPGVEESPLVHRRTVA
jgi:2-keto-3-deoxy-L-rhamnonate aldolase RhmA